MPTTNSVKKPKGMNKKSLQHFEKRLLDERKRVLKELGRADEALRRLYRAPENFGKCHQCGNEIAFERLDALPHARYCIDCKQREEDAKK